ncbi:DNA cytosine methyltransferase [Salmonella enterica]|nr:DNA cytosine methyltransferase [Salmonella enterica]
MSGIKFGSVCSGIEAASIAWEPLGWRAAWFAEIEPFPAAVLAQHWPQVPNLGDMTQIAARIDANEVEAPPVLVGGTPCQAFSISGKRGGLEDERGKLTLTYVRLADAIDRKRRERREPPGVFVWENVPGVFTIKDNAFGCFLAGLAGESYEIQPPRGKWANSGCVFGSKRVVAWRVLDAQFFGVPQQRRRVFVVASAYDGADPRKILFEQHSESICYPLERQNQQATSSEVARLPDGITFYRKLAFGEYVESETSSTRLASSDFDDLVVYPDLSVRKLTPVENERLQGFPDNHTQIPWKRRPAELCPVGPRNKAIGNSMAVPVMRWIGERIDRELAALMDKTEKEQKN